MRLQGNFYLLLRHAGAERKRKLVHAPIEFFLIRGRALVAQMGLQFIGRATKLLSYVNFRFSCLADFAAHGA